MRERDIKSPNVRHPLTNGFYPTVCEQSITISRIFFGFGKKNAFKLGIGAVEKVALFHNAPSRADSPRWRFNE
jgi:hypothetical protein